MNIDFNLVSSGKAQRELVSFGFSLFVNSGKASMMNRSGRKEATGEWGVRRNEGKLLFYHFS